MLNDLNSDLESFCFGPYQPQMWVQMLFWPQFLAELLMVLIDVVISLEKWQMDMAG